MGVDLHPWSAYAIGHGDWPNVWDQSDYEKELRPESMSPV